MWSENNCPAGLNQIYMDSGTQTRAGWVKNEGETNIVFQVFSQQLLFFKSLDYSNSWLGNVGVQG